MTIQPYTVRPGVVAGGSILLHPSVRPYTVRPRRVGGPDWDAQRFYFRATAVAEVSPVFDGAWDETTTAVRRMLAATPLAGDTVGAAALQSWTSGQLKLERQYVGPMMRGGVVFNGATVSMVTRCVENAAEDNVFARLGFRIVSADGATVRATLLAVGAYGSQTEYATSASLKNIALNDALASYTTQPGDRPVVETGFTDVAGTTPFARNWFGSDQAVDWTQVEGVPGVNGNPWLQIDPAA